MNDATAEKVANAVIVAGALGAAYYIVRTPPLRRLVWQLAVSALTVSAPAWFSREVRESWSASGRPTG